MSGRSRGSGSRPTVPRGSATGVPGARADRVVGTQARTLALVGKRRPRLRLLPGQLVPASEERRQAALSALQTLYRDFLEGGGLDSLQDRRSHGAPRQQERKAA